jgi:hypothetical protein
MDVFVDQDHWLYLADLVMQGSDYPGGRHMFASPMHLGSPPSHCESQKSSKVESSNLSAQFENVDLQDLHNRTSGGTAVPTSPCPRPPLRSQTTSNLQEKSIDWDLKESLLGIYELCALYNVLKYMLFYFQLH